MSQTTAEGQAVSFQWEHCSHCRCKQATFVKGDQVRCRRCGKFIRRAMDAVTKRVCLTEPVQIGAVLKELLAKVGVTAVLLLALLISSTTAAGNFSVTCSDQVLAREIADAAERYRRKLAIDWLGHELPDWQDRCPITVSEHGPKVGAGGATSFLFDVLPDGTAIVGKWQMTIQGSRERLLDSVVPHEVLHTIFAAHFLMPLPRWADEGACSTVESAVEQARLRTMLVEFLSQPTSRGIPFAEMFRLREYPPDILPLYAQGYSVADFLLLHGGRPAFVAFLGDGLDDDNWPAAVTASYGYSGLGELQNRWLDWVRLGCPRGAPPTQVRKQPIPDFYRGGWESPITPVMADVLNPHLNPGAHRFTHHVAFQQQQICIPGGQCFDGTQWRPSTAIRQPQVPIPRRNAPPTSPAAPPVQTTTINTVDLTPVLDRLKDLTSRTERIENTLSDVAGGVDGLAGQQTTLVEQVQQNQQTTVNTIHNHQAAVSQSIAETHAGLNEALGRRQAEVIKTIGESQAGLKDVIESNQAETVAASRKQSVELGAKVGKTVEDLAGASAQGALINSILVAVGISLPGGAAIPLGIMAFRAWRRRRAAHKKGSVPFEPTHNHDAYAHAWREERRQFESIIENLRAELRKHTANGPNIDVGANNAWQKEKQRLEAAIAELQLELERRHQEIVSVRNRYVHTPVDHEAKAWADAMKVVAEDKPHLTAACKLIESVKQQLMDGRKPVPTNL